MATSTIDPGYLAAYLSLPEPTITTLLDTPTVELVQAVLAAVTAKAHEHEDLKAEKLRVDIELESAVRSAESRSQGLKASVDKALNDVEQLRNKLTEEENLRSSLESELQAVKSSSTTSTSELETLRSRIANLESANRETVAILEAKTTANDSLAQDLQKQHAKGRELSQQISTLQQELQTANSAISSSRFKEQNLQQELDLAQRNNDWLDRELKTKSAEALKYRKEKGAKISELTRQYEDAKSSLESSQRTEQALRSRLDEVQQKYDDELAKVQQLREAAAHQEEGFRQELEQARRLGDLQAQQAKTHQNRLKEVEASLEKIKDDAALEINQARQEAEAARQDQEQAENTISDLRAEIDQLEAAVPPQAHPGSVPGTPRQGGLNGSVLGRSGSPAGSQFGTPGSLRKSAITATQAIDELYRVKGLLKTEKREKERLQDEISEMIEGLQAKQPEYEEEQREHERVKQELVEMSQLLDQAGKERDRARKESRKAESEASTAKAEAGILRQQLRDLSLQIKFLLADIDARQRGFDDLNAEERAQYERLAEGLITEGALDGLSDTHKFISQNLTVFKDVSELQEQNQKLLRLTRELGERMESEEAVAARHQAAQDHEEVKSLQMRIESYKDELKNVITRSESYIKERDMFRRMLQHRGQLPPQADLASEFGQSVDSNGVMPSVEQSPSKGGDANYAKLLRDLESHFDNYREEQTTDRRVMKEQMERLSSEKTSLQAEVSKISSQLTMASERFEMLQANYTMLQNENSELQKRTQSLYEQAAKQDLRSQQLAEDSIEAKGQVESMRNENANLKAEKKIWADRHERLSQDNESLTQERSRLNALIANLQSVQNEREISDSETRRRLQGQVENLESELNSTKRKLNDEMEDSKKMQLRKEYDAQQNQKRVDDLVSSLASVREELVATKTTKDHLQARVDELTIELKSAEERVQVLQPRPTPRPGTETSADGQQPDSVTKEQELAIEVSELKRDLELSKSELENAKSQMEQYKNISQQAEEELQSMNETQEQYREEMDRVIEEKEAKIRDLQQRIEDISSELTSANNEMSSLRTQQAEAARRVDEDKAALEAEILRLKEEDEKHATAAQFHQQDLRAQAEIATKAQQDYENELVKHAEAAKLLHSLRAEYNVLRTESATLRTEAESAKVTLAQSQSSWEERRIQFEAELAEMRSRRDDVNNQNKILHQQLDDLSAQLSSLKQNRTNASESMDTDSPETTQTFDRSIEEARELNRYLRREKEIVEVQYELSVQDCKRLKQQLEYSKQQLDEAKLKLDQERRAHANDGQSSLAHKDLMEKLTELNLFRESSITLRNEARQAQAQLAEKSKLVDELLEQIQPLETRVRELENVNETQVGEMRLLQEDRDRWEKRTQDILTKYDRIDPAEMEELRESLANLTSERDALTSGQQPLQEKIEALETEKASWQQIRQKIVDQAKERNRTLVKEKNEISAEREAALNAKKALEQQLVEARQTIATNIQEKQALEQKLSEMQQALEGSKASGENTQEAQASAQPDSRANAVLEQQLSDIRQELENAVKEKEAIEQQLSAVRQELEVARAERDAARTERDEALARAATAASNNVAMQNSSEGQVDETHSSHIPEEERKALQDRLAAAEAKSKECEEKAKKIEESMAATIKERSDKMKTILNQKLVESRAAAKAQLEAEYDAKLEQEKQAWIAENQSTLVANQAATAPAGESVPATPATPISATKSTAHGDELPILSDGQVRELMQKNTVVKNVMVANIKKKVEIETQRLKEEHEKTLMEAQKKADDSKTQAVIMEGKKSALKINMSDNKFKATFAKWQVVEAAAKETPQKPVVEVWEVAKNAKPPQPESMPPPASSLPASSAIQAPSSSTTAVKAEAKSDPPAANIVSRHPQPVQPMANAAGSNGASNLPVAPAPTQPAGNVRSALPLPRGGLGGGRGGNRGSMIPGARGGMAGMAGMGGRGRGGPANQLPRAASMGSSMNPGAQSFSPNVGNKRPRDDNQSGNQGGGKRMRGGGPQ